MPLAFPVSCLFQMFGYGRIAFLTHWATGATYDGLDPGDRLRRLGLLGDFCRALSPSTCTDRQPIETQYNTNVQVKKTL